MERKIILGTDGTSAHLYETGDGTSWSLNSGVGNGFGVTTNKNIASLAEFNGYLYASTFNSSTGGQL